MDYQYINSQSELTQLCEAMVGSAWIGFDTEFVSEHTYFPDLCLIQVISEQQLAVVDPRDGLDPTPFWRMLAEYTGRVIVHAGREEFLFCDRAVNARPADWFDTQIAAGLVGLEYPASYGKLIQRLLGEQVKKGETRTDWRKRPLSNSQLQYAVLDVTYLPPVHDKLMALLTEKSRLPWLADETQRWFDRIHQSETRERWRRVSGTAGLPYPAQLIVRELWRWRDEEARRRDCPPRRVLRDDLINEMARCGSSDINQIRSIRGMGRPDLRDHLEDIAGHVKLAKNQDPKMLPKRKSYRFPSQVDTLAQFLSTALSNICRSNSVATALVGTAQDIRELVAYHLDLIPDSTIPVLAQGWRAEIVGDVIFDLLHGRLGIRIQDPFSETPLAFDSFEQHG